ncbi:hypothetical protein NL676_025388 [Syzygium grande]|nr:hypothetical protein NL676_025388 [Syzygium grande]
MRVDSSAFTNCRGDSKKKKNEVETPNAHNPSSTSRRGRKETIAAENVSIAERTSQQETSVRERVATSGRRRPRRGRRRARGGGGLVAGGDGRRRKQPTDAAAEAGRRRHAGGGPRSWEATDAAAGAATPPLRRVGADARRWTSLREARTPPWAARGPRLLALRVQSSHSSSSFNVGSTREVNKRGKTVPMAVNNRIESVIRW